MPRSTKLTRSTSQMPNSTVPRRSSRLADFERGPNATSKQTIPVIRIIDSSEMPIRARQTRRSAKTVASSTKGGTHSVINSAEDAIESYSADVREYNVVVEASYSEVDMKESMPGPATERLIEVPLQQLGSGSQPPIALAKPTAIFGKRQESRRTKKETEEMISWLQARDGSPSKEDIEQKAVETNRPVESVRRWIVRNRHTAKTQRVHPHPSPYPHVDHLATRFDRYQTPPPSLRTPSVIQPENGPGPTRTPKRSQRRMAPVVVVAPNPVDFSAYTLKAGLLSSPSKVLLYDGTRMYKLSHSRTPSDPDTDAVSDAETEEDKEKDAIAALLLCSHDIHVAR
ncbi:hypothetical protein FRC19_008870 [Serendipita sp. 401]|nr:hypothetical protein FRC19_008870 [Serendipita sp. 401]KAG9051921.1 hypothetical protein FS842_010819 [Serendipita sp. 407]